MCPARAAALNPNEWPKMLINRRKFLTGLIAAPIIVRAGLLMPVRPLPVVERWPIGNWAEVHHMITRNGLITLHGRDSNGDFVVEMAEPGKSGVKNFRYVDRIEFPV
jgi:hypothetical protein